MVGAEVGPFAQIGLAENQGAGLAQAFDDEGIAWRRRIGQGERAGGGQHAVAGVDVVLEQDRDAVQRAARMGGVQLGGDRQRIGVGFDHRVQRRPLPVDRLDTRQRLRGQRAGIEPAGGQGPAELGDVGGGDGRLDVRRHEAPPTQHAGEGEDDCA
jgi:hypothetical protein